MLQINVDLNRKSAVVKFKDVASAKLAYECEEPVLGDQRIKVIYTVVNPTPTQEK